MNNEPVGSGTDDSVFDKIGVRRVVNGVGPATRLGGVPLHSSVVEAMANATRHPVRMDHLEERAGGELARMLGVEAAYVTSGASAALTLATAALIAGDDPSLIDALPRITNAPHRVAVLAAHRDPYDRAVEAAGAELIVVGYPNATHIGEVERALDAETAAVIYRPGRPGNHPSLAAICGAARRSDAHVVIDGALYAPPLANLTRWFDDGASFVALSGGKHFRGPQASGILCGRADLIDTVALQHQDMDERESTWARGARSGSSKTPPRHGVGRPMKVGREQIAGLLVAVERYIAAPGADDADGIRELQLLRTLLEPGRIPFNWHETSALSVPIIELDLGAVALDVDAFATALGGMPTPIYLEEAEAWRGVLIVHPMALVAGDANRISSAISDLEARFRQTPAIGGEA